MKNILIAYDLHKLGQRYHALRALIEHTFPTRWACLESTYIVQTELTCIQVAELCSAELDANDELLAIEVGPGWAVVGMESNCIDWLRDVVAP